MNEQITTTETITAAMSIEFFDQDGVPTPAEAELSYDAADPFAVSMLFKIDPVPVRWTFARDLMIEGYYEPTGDGDVHVWPCLSADGSAVVIVELDSPSGEVLVQINSRDMAAFITQMVIAVPVGAESDLVDFDAELDAILAA